MQKIIFKLLSFLYLTTTVFSAGIGSNPELPFQENRFSLVAEYEITSDSLNGFLVNNNLQLIKQNLVSSALWKLMDKDSLNITVYRLLFTDEVSAYEYLGNYISPDTKLLAVAWCSELPNDSVAVSWYENKIYLTIIPRTLIERGEKILKNLFLARKKLKEMPNFTKIFPEKDLISNSVKISTSGWLNQEYFHTTYYADYENNGIISRIFIIPVEKDSLLLSFQKFRQFWKERKLLTEQPFPGDLPYFVAQDLFMGKMICLLHRYYIIGMMNFPSVEWAEDKLAEIRKNLRKFPLH